MSSGMKLSLLYKIIFTDVSWYEIMFTEMSWYKIKYWVLFTPE